MKDVDQVRGHCLVAVSHDTNLLSLDNTCFLSYYVFHILRKHWISQELFTPHDRKIHGVYTSAISKDRDEAEMEKRGED